jgi:SAM-dependent MidA family methyltransferase
MAVRSYNTTVTPLTAILRDEILSQGPIAFRRFMDVALYHPAYGYYTGRQDPFGKHGDFYTAEQMQPVFGILIAHLIAGLKQELGEPEDFSVVELGAGRGEMAPALAPFRYVPVDVGAEMPERITGVVFANEFFDALPVDVLVRREKGYREMRIGWRDDRFAWVEGPEAKGELAVYAAQYGGALEEKGLLEVNLDALRWVEKIAASLERGFLVAIDYGYTTRERLRFPQGTLMSYRRHTAIENVIEEPGQRDITAHVDFSALEDRARACGLLRRRFEMLTQTLLREGETDQFAAALAAADEQQQARRRMQLKSLLFDLGETFRVLLVGKDRTK